MRCYASNDVVHARSIYRLKARWINVTHGLCNADRPNKAPSGLMLKFNFCGNRPESNRLGPVDQQVTMPDHLQPVFMVSLRYPQLWDATAASRNTTMVLATQKTSTQPRAFNELFDIVDQFDTVSPENPNLHREVNFDIKHPPQSLLSEAAAKHLDKLYQFLDRLLVRMFVVMSHSRRAVCSPFVACRRVDLTTG